MYLYTQNTPERNSFPDKNKLAELLEKVLNKKKLETGEGKAAYFGWDDFGGIDNQIDYFSKVVRNFAGIK